MTIFQPVMQSAKREVAWVHWICVFWPIFYAKPVSQAFMAFKTLDLAFSDSSVTVIGALFKSLPDLSCLGTKFSFRRPLPKAVARHVDKRRDAHKVIAPEIAIAVKKRRFSVRRRQLAN